MICEQKVDVIATALMFIGAIYNHVIIGFAPFQRLDTNILIIQILKEAIEDIIVNIYYKIR